MALGLVDYESNGTGGVVDFAPLYWMTTKPTSLFIPVGPEKVPAHSLVSKFSRELQTL